jgi:hypothetical protein
MSPEELRSFITKAERHATMLLGNDVTAMWNRQSFPVVFRSKKCDIDIVLRPTDHMHDQERGVFSIVVSSRPSADFHGGVELHLFQEHLAEAHKWIGQLMKCKKYYQIHHLLNEYLYTGTKMAFTSSTILIKRKDEGHPFPAVHRSN